MMLQIALAELRFQTRALRTWVTFGVFFGLCFLLTANAEEFERLAPGGTVLANAPYTLVDTLIKVSLFSVFAIPAFLANAVLRDVDHKFDTILFATPIREGDYLFGRFLGAFAALMVALAGAPLGLLLGSLWPWADTELLGPTHLGHYLVATLGVLLPSVLAVSAIVFAVAVLSRSLLLTYITVMALLVTYLVSGSSDAFPAILDPFLFEVFDAETRYWTASERNTQMLPWNAAVVQSRLLWLGIAGALLLLARGAFSFRKAARKKVKKADTVSLAESKVAGDLHSATDRGTPRWVRSTRWHQFFARTRFEVTAVLKSLPFGVVLGLSFLLLAVQLIDREILYGVQAHPVTRLMLPDVFIIVLAVMVVLVFYSAEVFWRERTHGIHQILDALPASNGVFVASKLTALVSIVVSILSLGIVLAIALQLSDGYSRLELGLYLQRGFLVPLVPFLCLAVLTCFFQTLASSRYLGILFFFVFLGALIASRDLYDVDHPLASFVFPGVAAPLSDMNGSGRFLVHGTWIYAYWVSIAGLLLLLTYLLFQRGTAQPLRFRLRRLRALRSRGFALPTALLGLSLVGTASGIVYNLHTLNDYHSRAAAEARRVAYETELGPHATLPMPRIVGIDLEVDLYPDEPRVAVRSRQVLENKTDEALSTVHVVFPPGVEIERVTLEDANLRERNDTLVPYYFFDLQRPLVPGEQRQLEFELEIAPKGFSAGRPDTQLVRNGTFLTNERITPTIGFSPDYVIEDADTREDHGLPPLPRRPELEDTTQHHHNVAHQNSDFLRFEATVSTTAEQIALTAGHLEATWTEGDRRFFRYAMDAPMRNMYPIVSGEYAVARGQWNDVTLEVFHHPPHDTNVERMVEAMHDSLELYSKLFGPYPFTHARIAEFAAYRAFAQAFAGTIPFSEAMGFLADVRPGDLDLPYYVTAHEMAHMWWGHVVSAANVQGDGFVHESLAQYSALRLMEETFGPAKIRPFLKNELDRYLAGRADDPVGEMPLYRVEKQQYIHYRKGSLALYGLREYLGADVVDGALRRLVELRGFSSTPYTTSTDVLELLKEEAGPEHHGLIEDFLERITLFDLEVTGSTVRELTDGRFEVAIEVAASKLYADGQGNETSAAFDLPVEIGVFTDSPDSATFDERAVLYLERLPVEDGESTITVVVDQKPNVVGIDPYNKLIDRDSDDNLREVE